MRCLVDNSCIPNRHDPSTSQMKLNKKEEVKAVMPTKKDARKEIFGIKTISIKLTEKRRKKFSLKNFPHRFSEQKNSLKERSELNTLIIVGIRRKNFDYKLCWMENEQTFPFKNIFHIHTVYHV